MVGITPEWIKVRPKVANLIPFPDNEDSVPPVPSCFLIGRIVWDVGLANKTGCISSDAQAWICRNPDYGYHSIHHRVRSQIRKAEREGSEIIRMSWEEAWPYIEKAVRDTLVRQQRQDVGSFLAYLHDLADVDRHRWRGQVELWAARRDSRIGGLMVGVRHRKTYHILHGFSMSSELRWCPNNLLVYKVTQHAFRELDCLQVNYGVQGLDKGRLSGLAHFKKHMGYQLMPCRETFLAKYWVRFGIMIASHSASACLSLMPSLSRLSFLRTLKGLGARLGSPKVLFLARRNLHLLLYGSSLLLMTVG